MFYANIYELGQAYGGPEEGGWYFKTFDPMHSEAFDTEAEAKARVTMLLANEWANEPDAREVYSVAYRGGRYAGWVEERPAYFQPEEWPRYE